MSKFTTEVRFICETANGQTESSGYDSVDDILDNVANQVMPDYPIFDENYRLTLNKKILSHYYTREICAETVGLWKLWLGNRMREIMPYYNQLYRSELLKFNPLYNVDIRTTHQRQNDEERTNSNSRSESRNDVRSNTRTADSTDMYSDTPQGGLGNFDWGDQYLTNARLKNDASNDNTIDHGKTSGSENGTAKIANTEQYLQRVYGKEGTESFSDLLMKYRKTFLNIDNEIIGKLSDLFFGLYE